ncbi:alpha/beta-glucosidase agdC [Apiospora arundinis]
MLKRRPGLKPFIITRSTFAGAGRYVQKWLGDNASRWDHYRSSIAGLLGFASVFQIPMEFYLRPLVAAAARHAIDLRYRLLDYLYTALQRQSRDGTPAINPLWYLYPDDPHTYGIDLQYFFGSCVLVSPVTDEDATDVRPYLPDDVFYELETGDAVRGHGGGDPVLIHDVPFDRIPLHVRGGCVVPLRIESANTTTELRKRGFELLVAPGLQPGHGGYDGVAAEGGALCGRRGFARRRCKPAWTALPILR